MDNLVKYMKSIPVIHRDEYKELKKIYGDEKILDSLQQIIMDEENNYRLNQGDIFVDSKAFYQLQLKLWEQYGYCFSKFNIYPFFQDILDKFCKSSVNRNNDHFGNDRLTMEEEVKYGFQLLEKKYVSFIDEDNNIDIEKLFLGISDRNTEKCVISMFLNFYKMMPMVSNQDKKIQLLLSHKLSDLDNLSYDKNKIFDEDLVWELQMYFDYRYANYKFSDCNLGLIRKVSNEFEPNYSFTFGDYFQEGYFGLVKAINMFDIRRGFKFSTYAVYWINSAIVLAYKEKMATIRIPAWAINYYNRLSRFDIEFFQKNGRHATTLELAELSGIDEMQVKNILDKVGIMTCQSIQKRVNSKTEEEAGLTIEDCLESPNSDFVDDVIQKISFEQLIILMDELLTDREKEVLELYFGLNQPSSLTYQEVADLYGCTRQRIQQILASGMKKLKGSYRVKNLNPYR